MASIEKNPCACNSNKLVELEHLILSNHESIEKRLDNISNEQITISSIVNPTGVDYKSDFNIESLRMRLEVNDRFSNLERTIEEDRILVGELFINQMDEIQKRIEIQEQIRSPMQLRSQFSSCTDI